MKTQTANTELPTSREENKKKYKKKEEQKLDINHYKRRQRANVARKWEEKKLADRLSRV